MVKGVSVKFKSYNETIPKLLNIIKFDGEIKKYDNIILKPSLMRRDSHNTPVAFVEEVLKFCLMHKNPGAKVFIAEGSDGEDTMDVFESARYHQLAENYSIGLIDLNDSEVEEIQDGEFIKFESINYPKILMNGFVITLPRLALDDEIEMQGSLSTMLGAFPASHYSGFFTKSKKKIITWPLKYSIHDILRCRMPDFTIIDASEYGLILTGKPLEMDKQAAKLLGRDWKTIGHLRLIDESFGKEIKENEEIKQSVSGEKK